MQTLFYTCLQAAHRVIRYLDLNLEPLAAKLRKDTRLEGDIRAAASRAPSKMFRCRVYTVTSCVVLLLMI